MLVAYDAKVTRVDLDDAPARRSPPATPVTDADGTRQASVLFPAGHEGRAWSCPTARRKPLDGPRRPRDRVHRRRRAGRRRCRARCPPSSGLHVRRRAVRRPGRRRRRDRGPLRQGRSSTTSTTSSSSPSAASSRPATTTARDGEWKAGAQRPRDQDPGDRRRQGPRSTPTATASPTTASASTTPSARASPQTRHVGDELWRVPMDHFTPVGPQLALRARPRRRAAESAPSPAPTSRPTATPARVQQGKGSIIGCQSQTLAEELPLVGTPFKLRYDTRRAGRRTDRSIEIPLTGRSDPGQPAAGALEVSVAGQQARRSRSRRKAEPVLRVRLGPQRRLRPRGPGPPAGHDPDRLHLRPGRYDTPSPFDARVRQVLRTEGEAIGGIRDENAGKIRQLAHGPRRVRRRRRLARRPRHRPRRLGARHPPRLRRAHAHALSRRRPGGRRRAGARRARRHRPAPATRATPTSRRTAASGSPTPRPTRSCASTSDGNATVDGRARSAAAEAARTAWPSSTNATRRTTRWRKGFPLARPMSVALAPDGGFYIADYLVDWGLQQGVDLPRRPGGPDPPASPAACATRAGRRRAGARDASMTAARPRGRPRRHALHRRLPQRPHPRDRRRRHDPHRRRRRPGGRRGYRGRHRRHAARACSSRMAVETGPEGEVYFGDDGGPGRSAPARPRRHGHHRRRRPTRSTPTTTATAARPRRRTSANPQGLSLGADGSRSTSPRPDRVRRVATDGIDHDRRRRRRRRRAGADRVPAGSVRFDGADGRRRRPRRRAVRRRPQSGLSRVSRPFPRSQRRRSWRSRPRTAREVYFFDAAGRHLRTQDGVTGVTLWRFGYDDAGRLATVTDADDRVTRIERDGDGHADGDRRPGRPAHRRSSVDGEERLTQVAGPGRRGHQARLRRRRAPRRADRPPRRPARVRLRRRRAARSATRTRRARRRRSRARRPTTGYIVTLTSPEGRKHTLGGRRAPGRRRVPGGDRARPAPRRRRGSASTASATRRSRPGRRSSSPRPRPALGLLRPGPAQARAPLAGRAHADDHGRRARSRWPTSPTRCRCSTITDTFTTNGRTSVLSYDAAARKETHDLARGPDRDDGLRRQGAPRRASSPGPGVAPITYEYDDRGLLQRTDAGQPRSTAGSYDARDRPERAHRRRRPAHGADLRRRRPGRRDQAAGRRHRALRVRRRGRPHRGHPAGRPAPRAQAATPRGALSGYEPARGRELRARATTATAG